MGNNSEKQIFENVYKHLEQRKNKNIKAEENNQLLMNKT